jgi:hypothetical protein
MSRLILALFLISIQAVAEDADFNYEFEASSSEESSSTTALHGKSECGEVSTGGFKIKHDPASEGLLLNIQKNEKTVGTYEPHIDGPGNKCLKLKEFEREGLILLEVCHGLTGTSVLVERHSVLVLRLDETRLRQLGDLEIKYVEREDDAVRVVNDKTYKTKKKDGKALLTLKDKATKKEAEHFF